jgi:hypothetical protein
MCIDKKINDKHNHSLYDLAFTHDCFRLHRGGIMLIPTQNDWGIGETWNPFDADYTEEYKEIMKRDEINGQRSKQTLSMLLSFAGRHGF